MDEILEDLPGVAGITDDVCVHGKDVKEHDDNLRRLMERAKLSSTQKSATYAKTKSPSLGIYTPRTGFALIQPKFKASRVCQSLRTKKTCRDSLAL